MLRSGEMEQGDFATAFFFGGIYKFLMHPGPSEERPPRIYSARD